jgi:transposase
VADSALSSEANLDQLAQTAITWSTRGPATVSEAQVALAHANPPAMDPLQEGYRDHELTSSDGGVEQRWVLIDSEARQPQAQRTADQQLRPQTDQEVKAFKTLCHTTFACEADARQALSAFAPDLQVTFLATNPGRATPRDDKRGRPGNGVQPDQVVYQSDGALASSRTPRQARIDQHGCFILATTALDETQLTPQALLAGDKGHVHAERGFRFMKAPSCLASALYLKKPERLMALFMVMTGCLLV